MIRDWPEPSIEDPRTQLKRRLQQKRCLVCGSRDIRGTSYFCVTHIVTHRFCSECETLRPSQPGEPRDRRCRACLAARGLADYRANPDAACYRICLKQMRERKQTRSDQLFDVLRRRIALARLVAATPDLSWRARGRLAGKSYQTLSKQYARQCEGTCRDVDAADRVRNKY